MTDHTLQGYLAHKLATCDPVLARVDAFSHQQGLAELGTVYRTEHLFADRFVALKHRHIEFVGGGNTFGETPNYAGEVGFLFLCHLNGRIYQRNWHGHIPVQRHDGALWCVLYSFKLREGDDIPAAVQGHWRPGARVDDRGQPFDTWIRFEAMERYLREFVAELDQSACEPFTLANANAWLDAL